jgi:hypothetical protein
LTIDDLNQQYFIVEVGNTPVVGEQVAHRDGARQWSEFIFRRYEDFKKLLIKEFIKVRQADGAVKTLPLADVWLRHPRGRQYKRLVYAPPGSTVEVGAHDLNGWRGFTVDPKPGSWARTRRFILDVICSGDERLFEWLLDWTADLFQQPGRRALTTPVLIGPQGTGKNFFAGIVLGRTFDGRHFISTTHTQQVFGEFNDILSGRCLVVLDEAGLRTAADYDRAKGLVGADTITINRKGLRIENEKSMLHLTILSNHAVPMKLDNDDRRFVFFDVADTYANDSEYFGAIIKELDEDGGREAMLHELLQRPITHDLFKAPTTTAKQRAKQENWTHETEFIYQTLEKATADSWPNHTDASTGERVRREKKKDLAAGFRAFIDATNSRREIVNAERALGTALRTLARRLASGTIWDVNRLVRIDGIRSRDYWTLPDLAEMRSAFAIAVGDSVSSLFPDPAEDDSNREAGDDVFVADMGFDAKDEM